QTRPLPDRPTASERPQECVLLHANWRDDGITRIWGQMHDAVYALLRLLRIHLSGRTFSARTTSGPLYENQIISWNWPAAKTLAPPSSWSALYLFLSDEALVNVECQPPELTFERSTILIMMEMWTPRYCDYCFKALMQ